MWELSAGPFSVSLLPQWLSSTCAERCKQQRALKWAPFFFHCCVPCSAGERNKAHNNERTTWGKGYEYSMVLFNCRNARVLGVVLRENLSMWESPKLLADPVLVDLAKRNVQNRLGINADQPGNVGHVLYEIKRLLKQRGGQ